MRTCTPPPPRPTYTALLSTTITINVPVVFMARYVMILRGEHHYEGHWKGWALKIETFLGHLDLMHNRYIGSFMYSSAVV